MQGAEGFDAVVYTADTGAEPDPGGRCGAEGGVEDDERRVHFGVREDGFLVREGVCAAAEARVFACAESCWDTDYGD